MTNLEWIHNASEEDLALILMCPYDTMENYSFGDLPCNQAGDESPKFCFECMKR